MSNPSATFWAWRRRGTGDAWRPSSACHVPKGRGGEFDPAVEAVGPFSTLDIAREEARERNAALRAERAASRPPRPFVPRPTVVPAARPRGAQIPGFSFEEVERGFQHVAQFGASMEDVRTNLVRASAAANEIGLSRPSASPPPPETRLGFLGRLGEALGAFWARFRGRGLARS